MRDKSENGFSYNIQWKFKKSNLEKKENAAKLKKNLFPAFFEPSSLFPAAIRNLL
jgi:hypothetical protein